MHLATSLAAALWLGAFSPTPTPLPVATLPPHTAPSPLPAPSPGPSQPGLTNDQMSKIDQIALDQLREQTVPGLSLAVVRDGRVVYSRGYGYSALELQQTAQDSSLYEVGSITKQFTACAILLLADEGRITLDMPLSLFVPDFPRGKEITVRDLLTMRSGIADYTDQPGVDTKVFGPATPADIVATVKSLPLDFTPGTQWEYSNTNYVLLGIVIEKASGQSYGNSVNEKITRPLAMRATSYGNFAASSPDLATGYVFDGQRIKPDKPWNLDWAYSSLGLVSNVLDLAVFDSALLQGKVITLTSLREMWTATSLKDGSKIPYGYGWSIESLYGHREIDDNGGLPGYNGRNATFPNDKFDVVVLGNSKSFDPGPAVRRIFELFYPPTPDQIAAQKQGDDVALGRARDVFKKLQAGSIDASMLLPTTAKRLTPKLMSQARSTLLRLGAPLRFEQTDNYTLGTQTTYFYRLTFKQAVLGFEISFDSAGKIGDLTVNPL
jgi:D-alanyl-D-alanine carboxypeptidase